jgi:hypothetical protein
VNSPLNAVRRLWEGKLANIAGWFDAVRARSSFARSVLDYPPEPAMLDAIEASPEGGNWRVQ